MVKPSEINEQIEAVGKMPTKRRVVVGGVIVATLIAGLGGIAVTTWVSEKAKQAAAPAPTATTAPELPPADLDLSTEKGTGGIIFNQSVVESHGTMRVHTGEGPVIFNETPVKSVPKGP